MNMIQNTYANKLIKRKNMKSFLKNILEKID